MADRGGEADMHGASGEADGACGPRRSPCQPARAGKSGDGEHARAGKGGPVRDAVTVAGATLLSRLLGFARDAATAHVLGAGIAADAFIVACRLPTFLRRLFGEGALSLALVPSFTGVRLQQGEAAAFGLFRHSMRRFALLLSLLCLGLVVAAPVAVAVLAPGLAPGTRELAASLLRFSAFYVLWVGLAGLCMGLLHSLGVFLAPALAPTAFNVCVLGSAALGVAGVWRPEYLLACGVLVGGAAQLAVQLPALWRHGVFAFRHRVPEADHAAAPAGAAPPLAGVPSVHPQPPGLWSALLGVFGASAHQTGVLVSTVVASYLAEGSIASLYYAERLVEFPLGVFGVAIGTATLPVLSSLHVSGRHEAFEGELSRALRLSFFVNLPAAAGLIAIAAPLVTVLFGHGAFDAHAVQGTVSALRAYALGLPAFAVARTLLAATHARGDVRSPVVAAAVSLVVVLGAGLALVAPFGVMGPPLAASLGAWCNVLLLHLGLVRGGVRCALVTRGLALQAVLSLVLCGGVLMLLEWLEAGQVRGPVMLLAGVLAGCVVYGAGVLGCGCPEVRELLAGMRGDGRGRGRMPR